MTSRTNRQLVLDIRQVLAELETLSEAKAAGVLAFGGSSTKPGHKILWMERDAGPQSLREVFEERFRAAAGDTEKLEETLEAALVALQDARVRPQRPVIDGPLWQPLFIQNAAGLHRTAAAITWNISQSYVRKIRRQHGVSETYGGPRCNKCGGEMAPGEGVVALWRCVGCGREIPREVHA